MRAVVRYLLLAASLAGAFFTLSVIRSEPSWSYRSHHWWELLIIWGVLAAFLINFVYLLSASNSRQRLSRIALARR
jgi:hypothetical protein